MKYTLITTLALSLSLPAYAMEEPTLKEQIDLARSEIVTVRALIDEKLKEDLPLEVKQEILNDKLALSMLSLQTTCIDGLNGLIEALERVALREKEEESKVRLNGSTQVIMDDDQEDDLVVVSDAKSIEITADDCKVTHLQ